MYSWGDYSWSGALRKELGWKHTQPWDPKVSRLHGKLEAEGDPCGDVTHREEGKEMSTNGGYVMWKTAGLRAAGGDKGKHIEQEH